MNKKIWVGMIVALLAITAAIFVSADFSGDEPQKQTFSEKIGPATCGSGTCNFECGGNCGVPKCGCGK